MTIFQQVALSCKKSMRLRPVLDKFRAQINEKNKFIDQIDEPLMIRQIIELKRGDDDCETSGNSTSDPQQILLKSLSLA